MTTNSRQDCNLSLGVLDGDLKRYYILSNAQKAIIYRWLVVFLFISEQQDNNGLAGITGDGGSAGRAVVIPVRMVISTFPH